MRNIKSIIIGLLLAVVILISIAVSVAYFHEEKLSRYLIAELNEYLLAEVEVEEVNFSLLKKLYFCLAAKVKQSLVFTMF